MDHGDTSHRDTGDPDTGDPDTGDPDTGDEVRAVRALVRLARLLECSTDLSMSQYRVLAAVADGGERATHLARGLALAKPTVTAAVDGLVERGLLSRVPLPDDRRSVRIALTEAGRRALAEAEAAMARQLRAVLDADRLAALASIRIGPNLRSGTEPAYRSRTEEPAADPSGAGR